MSSFELVVVVVIVAIYIWALGWLLTSDAGWPRRLGRGPRDRAR